MAFTEAAWNSCLRDVSNRLEALGRTMSDLGLPEPMDDSRELQRELLRWDRAQCQEFVDAHLPLLTPDEQQPIYDQILQATSTGQPLLMYVVMASQAGVKHS